MIDARFRSRLLELDGAMRSTLPLGLALTALAALATLQSACCFIPIPRKTTTKPALEVKVMDMTTQTPLAGATIRVTRHIEHPHYGEIKGEWALSTDARGEAKMSRADEREWVMPLMIHGVPFYMWRMCVSHPGYRTEFFRVNDPKEGEDEAKRKTQLTVQLKPGEGEPCPKNAKEPHVRPGDKPAGPGQPKDNPIIEVRSDGASGAQILHTEHTNFNVP